MLDLLTQRTFRKADFVETADGHVRLLAPVTHELAETIPRWAALLAPIAERTAHTLGQECHRTLDLAGWADEAAREAANAGPGTIPVVVAKRRGRGPEDAYALLRLSDFAVLLARMTTVSERGST